MNNKTISNVTYNNLMKSINCVDEYKKSIIVEFCKKYINYHKVLRFFVSHFDESLSNPFESLSFYTYVEQLLYFNKIYKFKIQNGLITAISSFYRFYQTYELNLFTQDNYSTQLLYKTGIGQDIINGFQVINYNILDKIPESDKWIVCYKAGEKTECINVNRVDFSLIENKTFKFWVKTYIWKYDALFSRKISLISIFSKMFNYINELKTGKQLSFYTTPNNNFDDINTQEVMALKTYILSKYENADTQGKFIYNLKSLLLLISENGIHKFEPGVFMTLIHHKNFFRNNGTPIPDSDLKKLSCKLSELADDNIVYNLYYLIFYIALETELRPRSIFDLETNCIKITAKKNEYILCAISKTSNREQVEIPTTIFVKKCIDKVLKLTSKYRIRNTNENLKTQLFIMPNKSKNGFKKIDYCNFNIFFKKICNSIGIPKYTLCNLRDTHMTKAEEYVIRQQLSDSQFRTLSSHKSSNTTITHYSNPSIIEMLEAVNGIIIGDVDISGTIKPGLDSSIQNINNLVSNNCGYCSSDSCTCFSDLDCLLCKSFVTTFDRKIYFEERLKMINKRIGTAQYEHDIADYIAIKRLVARYLSEIITMEEVEHAKSRHGKK